MSPAVAAAAMVPAALIAVMVIFPVMMPIPIVMIVRLVTMVVIIIPVIVVVFVAKPDPIVPAGTNPDHCLILLIIDIVILIRTHLNFRPACTGKKREPQTTNQETIFHRSPIKF